MQQNFSKKFLLLIADYSNAVRTIVRLIIVLVVPYDFFDSIALHFLVSLCYKALVVNLMFSLFFKNLIQALAK